MRVPRYEARVTYPTRAPVVRGDVGTAALVPQAVGGLGRVIGQIGAAVGQRALELKQEEEDNYIIEQANTFDDLLLPEFINARGKIGKEAVGNVERIRAFSLERQQTILDKAPPHLQDVLKQKLEMRSQHYERRLATHEAIERRRVRLINADASRENAAKKAYNMSDSLIRLDEIALQVAEFAGIARAESIQLGIPFSEKDRSDIYAAAVDGMIVDNPHRAGELLKIVESELVTERVKYYEKAIPVAVKAAKAEQKANEAKIKIEAKEILEAAREKTENQFFIDLENRELTFTKIVESNLHPDDKRLWEKLRQAQADANAKGEEAFKFSDPDYYNDMLDLAMSGAILPTKIYPAESILSKADATALRGIAKRAQDEAEKPELQLQKLATDVGRKMIIKGTVLTGFDAREVKDAYLFEHDLRAELANEADPQKRIRMLTPGTRDYVVDRLVAPYLRTLNEQISDMAEQLQGIAEPGAIEEVEGESTGARVFRAPIVDPDRERAIELLRNNGKLVNEKTIGIVIERMKAGE